MYKKPVSNIDFAKVEKEILEFWKKNEVFEKSISQYSNSENSFVFYDGPPFANGLPHYGHLLTSFVKDIFARYQTMLGKKTERKFGWDCHGLPAEMEVEKSGLKIENKKDLQEIGIFNKACEKSVLKYTQEWKDYVTKAGRWVDFDNGYKTMDKSYMESVLGAFKNLHHKGLLYEGYRVMPYSWACETPLSNFETKMDNAYRQKASKAATVKFELEDGRKCLVWTTTPWTLPANLALAVGCNIDYVEIKNKNEKDEEEIIIIAKALYKNYAKELTIKGEEEPKVIREFKGEELIGKKYKPLFPYLANTNNAFQILEADFVTTEDGTGIVHLAPAHGEDDKIVCDENNIPTIDLTDYKGRYVIEKELEEVKLDGRRVLEYNEERKNYDGVNDDIIKYLKGQGAWLKTEQYLHNYPHCWRTDTPLIYKTVSSWYVEVTKFKDRMIELNQSINWIPDHIKDGQFGKWLEGARDWSISRNRFWGCPVPVWKSTDPKSKKLYVFGSAKEMEEFFQTEVKDLHRPFIDTLTKTDPDNPEHTIKRVDDVLDCWFESGSMPFASVGYNPHTKDGLIDEKTFKSRYPADFIVEYMAQTRGWFYTMVVLGVALFDEVPFKNCICHGVILDEDSQKLSKRLRNYPDPMEVFDTIGSDAMRWFVISSPVMNGGDLNIDRDGKGFREVMRLVIKPIYNAYSFFALYANADSITAREDYSSQNVMDRYILSKLKELSIEIKSSLDSYKTYEASRSITNFIETLNNWYIRRNKERFWKAEKDQDKTDAYNTLYTVLINFSKISAPLLPFLGEKLWRDLV